jgi:gamma-glutamylcyclotransferase (GGCT)/AIG2-like uncharacterized protein YtfP
MRFFVYASMLTGEPHHAELAGAKPVAALRTEAGYALVELPTMAGLVRSREGSVLGEVYELERKVFLEIMKQARHPGLFQLARVKLEDGTEITPMEVKRQKVTLGARDGTVVFLNACEVGATGSVLGNVGGWADAFLAREFRAFIAPLWAIDEEDAATVTTELMHAIVRQQQPLGAALRDLRAKHGPVSPTFYSYLLYGDVTARLGTA